MKRLLSQPVPAFIISVGLLGLTAYAVSHFPRSIVAFMLFQASILVLYFAQMPAWVKGPLAGLTLIVLMPVVGSINGYYLEIAIQVGIFVALALGLNIVVGLAGLLDLGYVAFFAVGAYTWAVFGSPQANQFLPGGLFPLPQWCRARRKVSTLGSALTAGITYLSTYSLNFSPFPVGIVNAVIVSVRISGSCSCS